MQLIWVASPRYIADSNRIADLSVTAAENVESYGRVAFEFCFVTFIRYRNVNHFILQSIVCTCIQNYVRISTAAVRGRYHD